MILWCVAQSAVKSNKNKFEIATSAGVLLAPDVKTAQSEAMLRCRDEFPKDRGYVGHTVEVLSVPQSFIEEVLRETDG